MHISLPGEPKRILIVKPSAMGDIVHTLPFLHLLRKRFKTAEISWLVVPAFASLLQNHRLLDHVLLFERRRFSNLWRDASAAKGLFKFALALKRQQFDLVIDLQGLFRSGWIAWQTRAKVRVGFGYAREGAPMFYTHRVSTPGHERHAVERYLDVAEALGCGREPVMFDFDVPKTARERVKSLVPAEPYAVICPTTNWPTKRWPLERFVRLAAPLEQELALRTVVSGGPDVATMPFGDRAINLGGKTDLKELVALIEGASLVIANDSGPMHIAAALNKPLVTIFGPTNPVRTGPYARPDAVLQLELVCRPCYSKSCSHTSCMNWIEVEHVMKAARAQLDVTRTFMSS